MLIGNCTVSALMLKGKEGIQKLLKQTIELRRGNKKIKEGTYSSGIAIVAEQQAKQIVKELSVTAELRNKNATNDKQV